jgi:hypothetical protein
VPLRYPLDCAPRTSATSRSIDTISRPVVPANPPDVSMLRSRRSNHAKTGSKPGNVVPPPRHVVSTPAPRAASFAIPAPRDTRVIPGHRALRFKTVYVTFHGEIAEISMNLRSLTNAQSHLRPTVSSHRPLPLRAFQQCLEHLQSSSRVPSSRRSHLASRTWIQRCISIPCIATLCTSRFEQN